MRIAHKSVVVVADGRKMLLFRNAGRPDDPSLELERTCEQDNLPNRELKSDSPGRSTASVGLGRNAFDEADFHEIEEMRFASETAEMLRRRALSNDFDSLIVIAPPKTLGALRKHYHKEVETRLKAEIAKDLTGHPVKEIERIIVQS